MSPSGLIWSWQIIRWSGLENIWCKGDSLLLTFLSLSFKLSKEGHLWKIFGAKEGGKVMPFLTPFLVSLFFTVRFQMSHKRFPPCHLSFIVFQMSHKRCPPNIFQGVASVENIWCQGRWQGDAPLVTHLSSQPLSPEFYNFSVMLRIPRIIDTCNICKYALAKAPRQTKVQILIMIHMNAMKIQIIRWSIKCIQNS